MEVEPQWKMLPEVVAHPASVDIVEFDPLLLSSLFGLAIGSAAKQQK
jgi:hypothetical protein